MKLLLISILFIASIVAGGQDNSSLHNNEDAISKCRQNMASIEIGGNGVIYSINYSRILSCGQTTSFIPRIGFEVLGDQTNFFQFIVPLELYLRTGRHKHHFELGIGSTIIYTSDPGTKNYHSTLIFGRIGYSYQKPGSRFNYRIGFTPFVDYEFNYSNSGVLPFAGISVGYLF